MEATRASPKQRGSTMKITSPPARSGIRYWRLLLLGTLALAGNAAFATADPDSVAFTLEGCRNDGSITFPVLGPFICPDSAYTTGNLGKGWNELDLVPHRLFAKAGNSAPATQTYAMGVAADNLDAGHPGYDIMSPPVLNTALSDSSCTAAGFTGQQTLSPGVGGTDASIYRILTITQNKSTTCVYDWYERLAIGSHLYPGSSLHTDALNQNLGVSGIGARDVSIPVKEISPQELSKDMDATQGATVNWEVTKEGTPATVNFGDVCSPDAGSPQTASITVTWTKEPAVGGDITVTTHVYATNPASRPLFVDVVDTVYQGTQQVTTIDVFDSGQVTAPANSTTLVFSKTFTVDSSFGGVGDNLNDVAVATYIDPVTLLAAGTVTATASTTIALGSVADGTADITDSESITGPGLTFSVAQPLYGDFTNYTADTETTGPVNWEDPGQTTSGQVTFSKTIYITPLLVTSGVLSDTAHAVLASHTVNSNTVSISIGSSATVKLTVSKSIPAGYLSQAGDTLATFFHIDGPGGYTNDIELDFAFGGSTTQSQDFTGLAPGIYTVTEDVAKAQFCDVAKTCTNTTLLNPVSNPIQADLSVPGDGDMTNHCSGTTAFENTLLQLGIKVKAKKVTDPALLAGDPDLLWTLTLKKAGVQICDTLQVTAGADFAYFQGLGADCDLTQAGTYTVEETNKTGWIPGLAVPNDGVNTHVCSFTIVDVITDDGKVFTCTFNNQRNGHVKVIKTFQGAPPTGAQAFTFSLREGASSGIPGTTDETLTANAADNWTLNFVTLLVPNNHYQLCEEGIQPGFGNNIKSQFGVNAFDADNSTVCFDFVATTGLLTFTIDNTPPPGNPGTARTIGYWKNWASCKQSNGKQAPVLDQTLVKATPPGIHIGLVDLSATTVPAGSCSNAVNLLNKSTLTGQKEASDPLFNMAAQLLAADLNIVAGAASCTKVNNAITQAQALLVKYNFNGSYPYSPKISKADTTTANNLATLLDNYNNNVPGTCP
jgi:hypothetical protein